MNPHNMETHPMNTTDVIVPEVLPPIEAKLVKYSSETGLEKTASQTLFEAFRPVFVKARDALADARGVAESVKDATCVREIMRSRACRLAIRKIRLEGDELREKQKREALLYGKAVQGFYNILLADLSPVETALQEAEDIAERMEAKRLAELKAAREAELGPLLETPVLGDLSELSETNYQAMLKDAKLLRQAKLEATAKAEAERLAKEEAARAERERIAAENAALKAEVDRREAEYKAEREAARQAAEKKLAEERAEAKAEADRIAEVARREREAEAAKAKAEAERQAAIAAEERKQLEAQAKAAREAAEKLRADLAAKAKAEAAETARVEAERKAAAAATKKAAAAPDNAKLKAFAETIRALALPQLSNPVKQSALQAAVERLAAWLDAATGDELL